MSGKLANVQRQMVLAKLRDGRAMVDNAIALDAPEKVTDNAPRRSTRLPGSCARSKLALDPALDRVARDPSGAIPAPKAETPPLNVTHR